MENTTLNYVLKQNYKLFKTFFFTAFIFFLFRILYFLRFGELDYISEYSYDFFKAFFIGFRLDTITILYVFSLVFIINFFFFIKNKNLHLILNKISKIYLISFISLLILFLFTDQEYYTYFQQHINIMVFGFIEDDTQAVLKSMWTDHPIIIILIIWLALIFITYKVVTKIYANNFFIKSKIVYINIIIFIAYIFLYASSIRGSFGVFPLSIEDTTISDNKFINLLCQNGFITFEAAVKEHKKSREKISNAQLLAKYNYSSINQAIADFYQIPEASIKNKSYTDFLFKKTKKDTFLEENPPNVIFILAESFGNYYLKFHSKDLNLLGDFEKHIKEDLFFQNFLSSTRGTIFSLESILLNKNYPPLSDTKERFNSYKSSVAFPFYKAGYETIFITGGKIAWRNLNEMLPNQYFSESYGQSVILKNIKGSSTNTWGVYDEFLFDEIYRKLSEKSDKPKLIIALTTTNHTPYEIPDNYVPYSLKINDSIKDIIISNNKIAELSFKSYQYTNDKFGKMLTKIKSSNLGKNTIIGFSGDHNSYTLFPFENPNTKEINKHSVPFYLYVPKKYIRDNTVNTKRFGSHKDIFPTLFNISLSNQEYFSLGNNLLEKNAKDSLFFGINGSFHIGHPKFPKDILDKKVKAYMFLSDYYFNQK